MRALITAGITIVFMTLCGGVVPTLAAFPGQNGLIAFHTDRDGNDEIYVMNPDGSEQVNLTNHPTDDKQPQWSADGTRIVFRRGNDDADREIWVMNADGSDQEQLTFNDTEDEEPSWSPDGTNILFTADRHGIKQLYVMNADGSGQMRLIDDEGAAYREPKWSPDGTLIAYRRNPGGSETREIWVMNADGTNRRQLTDNGAEDEEPAWSPDGARIAFETDRDDGVTKEIYVMNADGSSPMALTMQGGNVPEWSPDGSRIVFRSDRDGNLEIYSMNADGSDQVRLTNTGTEDGAPSWQPLVSATTTTMSTGSTTTTTFPGQLLAGKKLLLKDDSANLDKRRLKLLIKDRTISLGGGNESADDPTIHGGTLHVVSRSGDGFRAIYDLPADRWAYKGKPGKNKGYKLKNAGPIKTILVKAGKLVKAIGKGADLGHSLVGDPEPVHVALTIGTQTYCATFGGRTSYAPGKKYLAKKAEGPETCAALVPECGDGVLEEGDRCPLLEGPSDTLAVDAVFDYDAVPHVTEAERDVEADARALVRTRLEIGFVPTATVGEVNGLLEGIGGQIISMVENVASLVVLLPDPGTVPVLDTIVGDLESLPIVRWVQKAYELGPGLLPGNYQPGGALFGRLDHHLAIGGAAAWNARLARRGDVPVVVHDWFGNGAPDGTLVDVAGLPASDFGTVGLGPMQKGEHGYHVLATVAGTFGGTATATGMVTGIVPGTVQVRAIDRRVLDGLSANNRSIHILKNFGGNAVLNTSIEYKSCTLPVAVPNNAAVSWVEKVQAASLEDRFLHLTCAGNRQSTCLAQTDSETSSPYAAAALLPLTSYLVLPVANLTNILAVENARNDAGPAFAPRCLSSGAKFPGPAAGPATNVVAGIGTSVWSLRNRTGSAGNKSGCSMATPQVAGLAAYIWSIDPTMTRQQVMDVLTSTGTPLTGTAGGAGCGSIDPKPVVDAYAAVLSLDEATPPTPASAHVRHAILDVDDDGDFDEADLTEFILALIEPVTGLLQEPTDVEYDRFDLNGDGYTGGPTRVAPFDLDRVGSTQYGANQLDRVTHDVEGSPAYFDEAALTDLGILCYYAYSDLYVGTEQRRRELLGHERCAPLILTVSLAPEITPGVAETLEVFVGREGAAGSEPVADVYLELLSSGGTVMPTDGLSNAQGEFTAQVELGQTSGAIDVVVRALSAPGGSAFAERTVRSTALCTDAPVQVELDVGNGEPNPEIDGPVLRSGTEYRVTVEGTVSIWTSEWQSGVCKGAPGAGVGGPTGLDAHYWFAIPVGSSLCGGDFNCCPNHTSKFRMSVDGGGDFDHVDPPDDSYRASHRYDHLVTGEGQPIAFRWEESSSRGDDYGVFEVTVACASDTTTTTSTSTTTTTTTSTTTTTTTSTSMTTMQPSTTLVGTTTTTTTLPGGGGIFYRQYDATGPVGPTVDVNDELRAESVMLGSASLLLAPVSYVGSPVPQADAHLACWTDTGASFTGSASVTNLFGVQTIDVGNPASACVPVDGTLAPTNAYTCYAATGSSAQTNAFLSDTFVTESADVTAPIAVCLPAEIDGSVVVAPLSYLVCYATATTASPVGTVAVSTAIGASDFDVGLPAGVCLPSIVQSITPGP